MDVPRAFWGVVSVGNPLRPIEPIVESLAEAERLMNSQGRYSVRLFNTRGDAEAYLQDPTAPRWFQQGPPLEMEDGVIDCDASSSDSDSDSDSGRGWGAANAAVAVAAISGGGDGAGATPPRAHESGYRGPVPRPTTEWVDRMLKVLRPTCELDPIQRQVIDDVLVRKRNIFLTGSGGVGKSFVTKLLIDLFKKHYALHGVDFSRRVCVTASTGIAATHVDGATLHSATGIGIPYCWRDFGRIFNMDGINERLWSRDYEVLFIDEVSMVAGEMLDGLDDILRQVRRNEAKAFGGLQLVFVGDLAQLSPIQEKLERYKEQDFLPRDDWTFDRAFEFWNIPVVVNGQRQEPLFTNRGFVVESNAWWNADLKIVELTRVFRQKDADFIARLNRMRKGQSDWEDVNWMNKNFFEPYKGQPLLSPPGKLAASPASGAFASSVAKGAEEPAPDPDPLHLYAKNKKVDARNEEKMRWLRDKGNKIDAYDFIWHVKEGIFGRRDPPFCVEEKYAAGVQQLQDNKLFYNRLLAADRLELKVGAKVILLKNLDQISEQRLVNGSIGTIIRWASKLEEVKYDSVKVINGQMGGVGPASKEERHSLVKHTEDYIQQWLKKNPTKVPIVRFLNGRVKAINPDIFTENIVGMGATCRIQMPLRIAFAISIHKSQGMTLDQALVDIADCFTGGQAYVAISRVGPREGLRFKSPLTMEKIQAEATFLLWERLRLEMEQLRAAVLALLPPAERPLVESLGLKSLQEYAQAALKAKDTDRELRSALVHLNNSLGRLKPGKRPRAQEQLEAERELLRQQRGMPGKPNALVKGIAHWQMLPWLKRGWNWAPSMPPREASPQAAAMLSPGFA